MVRVVVVVARTSARVAKVVKMLLRESLEEEEEGFDGIFICLIMLILANSQLVKQIILILN